MSDPILTAQDVHIEYSGGAHAVRGVSLELLAGETLGLVGESGSGKSSLARALVGLEHIKSGRIAYQGTELPRDLRLPRQTRLDLQMVFQDPFSALNPKRRIGATLADALRARSGVRPSAEEVVELLRSVGLGPQFAQRFPAEASGGQLQRVVIARALAPKPKVLVADEAVSALDVSVQAQILDLLADLREQLGLSMLFVSHDLGVIRHISDRVAVLRLGELVELGETEQLVAAPRHPYTEQLLAAVPDVEEAAARAG